MGITASKRLRKQSDFNQVRTQGKRILCGPFIFQVLCDPTQAASTARIGLIASRRVGNAVKRNLGKRQFREIFRRNEQLLPARAKVVVVLRANFDTYGFADLESRFQRACRTTMRTYELATLPGSVTDV